MNAPQQDDWLQSDALTHAVVLFNRRRFFECHEVIEDELWRPLPPGEDKTCLQGILQVAVGFLHWQRWNYTGANNLLQAGLEKLESLTDLARYDAVFNLSSMIPRVRYALETLRAAGPEDWEELSLDALVPIIRFAEAQMQSF